MRCWTLQKPKLTWIGRACRSEVVTGSELFDMRKQQVRAYGVNANERDTLDALICDRSRQSARRLVIWPGHIEDEEVSCPIRRMNWPRNFRRLWI